MNEFIVCFDVEFKIVVIVLHMFSKKIKHFKVYSQYQQKPLF